MIDDVSALVRRAADEAIRPRFRRLAEGDVSFKSPGDPVTVADHESEKLLTEGLTALLPGSSVVGEEAVAEDPGLLGRAADAGDVWVVDPLDGTKNFAAGHGPFAVMVALLRGGALVAGWILDVPNDSLAVAEAGSGAYVDGVRLHARGDAPAAAELRGAVAMTYLPDHLKAHVETRRDALGAVLPPLHCAGEEYPAVVAGRQDFVLFWRTLPWDHAPGALLVREAGGVVRRFDGSDYTVGDDRTGLLVAANDGIWHAARSVLLPG
ncbi:inositol monophosphatase family protein [Spirilliplanes yamanashiensis]|uniref:Inositol monophosphatase n=1 Tax=Spirilliplanes yamanashiensis TaxID=42233 RepID=A0A8J3YA47_9ACTN|nr:inositol monophosphatase family protein [Spirilliplanes yamanashiensis]MDP9815759.1 fructose-1,6-bisphosphatase/inositol monophosphatase family enzyme [Spirilliplanes yamanashiensis]GIJ04013.1 inositol monophosphatase [Spirilliplanes yamanashiensis]